MSLRLIEIYVDKGHTDTLAAIAEQQEAVDCYLGAVAEDGRQTVRILVSPSSQQAILDLIQTALSGSEGWRIVLLPVEAALPEPPKSEGKKILPSSKTATREELLSDIRTGTRLDRAYLMLTFLSTIVAAIGLLNDNVAVLIGAMVIAPLLGPNLAFIFAIAIGDRTLMGQSVRTTAAGLLLVVISSALLGMIWPYGFESQEVLNRTVVGFEDVALALAAGAAAVLSLTTGVSSTLVGVMVAVALFLTSSEGAANERTSVTSSSAAIVAWMNGKPFARGVASVVRKLKPPDSALPLPNAAVCTYSSMSPMPGGIRAGLLVRNQLTPN